MNNFNILNHSYLILMKKNDISIYCINFCNGAVSKLVTPIGDEKATENSLPTAPHDPDVLDPSFVRPSFTG